jgi:hypothetical protein
MIDCKSCVKSDVCKEIKTLPDRLKDLSNCPEMQALAMFSHNMQCPCYVQATKILGGHYEQ